MAVALQQRIVLNIDWDGYASIGETLRDQPVRMTYDSGNLEIWKPSFEHEGIRERLGRMVNVLTEELNLDVMSGGLTTFAREELNCGLEADECYWVQHEAQMRGKTSIAPGVDPPPDLAVEVEITRNIVKRLKIYAALGFPEVWRYDGKKLEVLLLSPPGEYEASETSKALPVAPIAELTRFLGLGRKQSETQVIRQFRVWVRQQQAEEWGAKKSRGRKKK